MAKSRGKLSNDDKLFSGKWTTLYREATQDLSYLLTRGYGLKSSVALVGHHYRMNVRQQKALSRVAASQTAIINRQQKSIAPNHLTNKIVLIDGFNILILLENILSGAYIFQCQDGVYRDISSIHGSYKRVNQTQDALLLIGKVLHELNIKKAIWYFDAPVSNSGMLKTMLYELASNHDFNWEVHLDNNPDTLLIASQEIVISADAWILDECQQWFNFSDYLLTKHIQHTAIVCCI